jgi:hypothetical protein
VVVNNAQLQINVDAGGRVLGVHNDLLPTVDSALAGVEPRRGADQAVASLAKHLGVQLRSAPRPMKAEAGARQRTRVDVEGLSSEPIEAELAVLPVRRGEARLVWRFQVHTPDQQHGYDVTVDAHTGEVWTRFDWVASDSYKVYPAPVESPNHVQYQYGFNEAAGNFQVNTYGRGGLGNDDVRAEAQDGGGANNANIFTPPDGQRPRMQMYRWVTVTPNRDGDLDAGIIVHEYGHGISNRLVGGPSNVSCLSNPQGPGEGISDFLSLWYTARATDTGPRGRGMGTYVLNQPTTGVGIRAQRYSTDPAVNTWTYASINGMDVPHGVGSVFAQAMWEAYWALVNHWGFSANLLAATGGAGNQRMMLYFTQGLKNTPCSPTFTQVRDGIIQAATSLNNGEDVCRLWKAFAGFGLGTNAISGGSASTTPTNGFALPAACQ